MGTYLILSIAIISVFLVGTGWALEEKMGLELEWVFNTSNQFPGKTFGAGHQGPPTVWDIDNDDVNEVLWGTRRGDSKRLWCIDGDGIFKWIYPPIDEDGLPGDPTSKVSLVDVDNDGIYELTLAGRGGRLHIIEPDGSVKWKWDSPISGDTMHGAPQAYDVDGDGLVEFFLNTNDGYIHRVDFDPNTGLVLTWTSLQAGAGNQGQPNIVDIDKDGVFEVLVASQDFLLYCFSADTGGEEWRFNTGANMPTNQVIVADVNRDGEYEAVVWTDAPTSAVIVVSYLGWEVSRWTHPREGIALRLCQAIGDVDEDGSMDMAVMSGNSVFCIDIGAETPYTKWEANFSQLSDEGTLPEGAAADMWSSYQLIADIDGDDDQEILWLAPFPIVTDGAIGEIEGYFVDEFIARNRRQENGGWWGDVDRDGVSEWLCELNGNSHPETQLYCLTMGGKFPAEAYWPEYFHCAYPAEYQAQQDWLLLKAAYSNSLWFPISNRFSVLVVSLIIIITKSASSTRISEKVSLR